MERYYRNLVIIAVIISLGIIAINTTLKKEIIILDNHQTYHIKTFKKDMTGLFEAQGIVLASTDKVIPALETKLESGLEIQIVRSFPVTIVIGDQVASHYTTLLKIGDILKEANIPVSSLDKVYPDVDQFLKGDRKIELVKVEKKMIEHIEPVAYNVEMRRTEQLKSGTAEEKIVGAYGEALEQVEVLIENGREVSREVKEWSYTSEPVSGQLMKGKEKFLVLSDGTPYRYLKVLDMVASAYDLSYASCGKYPDHPQYGITYSGTKARPGVVAVDPRTIKLKSKLYVESLDRLSDYGFSSAEDTGSAIKSNRIDLFISDNSQAMRYGIRSVRVYVLEDTFDDTLMVGYSR
jgi:3D (Asp-Asp-Asp) domain-containing protein